MHFLEMSAMCLKDKKVLIRSDLNVPIKNEQIVNEERLLAAIPTFKQAFEQGAESVTVISHLGRPKAGQHQPEFSLLPVAKALENYMEHPVFFTNEWTKSSFIPKKGYLNILENIRFQKGEIENSKILSHQMACLCDIFVMDAFGTAHRAHASTYGVGFAAPTVCAGPLLIYEIKMLDRILKNAEKLTVTIVVALNYRQIIGIKIIIEYCLRLIPGGG